MQIGSDEHRQEYFAQSLPKQINESIWFLDLQIFSAERELESLREQKEEASTKLENKEYPSAGDGRKAIKEVDDSIAQVLMTLANIQSQQTDLRERLNEVNDYAKAQGWKAA